MSVQIVVTSQMVFLVVRILRFINVNIAEGVIALNVVIAVQIVDRKTKERWARCGRDESIAPGY